MQYTMTRSTKNMAGVSEEEQVNHLVEEVVAIVAEHRFEAGMELLLMRHQIGKAILAHPLYAKRKKGQGNLLQQVARESRIGERTTRYCVEFAEKWPSFEEFTRSYFDGHKLPIWRDIVKKELPSGKREEQKVETLGCRHCPMHCKIEA